MTNSQTLPNYRASTDYKRRSALATYVREPIVPDVKMPAVTVSIQWNATRKSYRAVATAVTFEQSSIGHSVTSFMMYAAPRLVVDETEQQGRFNASKFEAFISDVLEDPSPALRDFILLHTAETVTTEATR